MKAKELYAHLEKDFIKSGLADDWAARMTTVKDFLAPEFKKRSMGLVCDNTEEVERVYTAVFPTDEVLRSVMNRRRSLLFIHHPAIWDIRKAPEIFQQMSQELLEKLRANEVSIYNLHSPLDNYGSYSTSKSLADALGIEDLKPFAKYEGGLAGVIGKTGFKTVQALSRKFERVLGHRSKLYLYGDQKIHNGKVAVVAGGGNELDILQEIADKGINTFVTGITALSDYSKRAHDYARQKGINVLGGTHYSTEKQACQQICKYFRKLGLPCQFIEGKPILEDL